MTFPAGTPLNAFFAWNEAQWRLDRRYTIACDLFYLYRQFGGDGAGIPICVSHIAIRSGHSVAVSGRTSSSRLPGSQRPGRSRPSMADAPVVAAAHRVVTSLLASTGSAEPDIHAAVFAAFEELSRFVDLAALARPRPRRINAPSVAGAAQDPCHQAERPLATSSRRSGLRRRSAGTTPPTRSPC